MDEDISLDDTDPYIMVNPAITSKRHTAKLAHITGRRFENASADGFARMTATVANAQDTI